MFLLLSHLFLILILISFSVEEIFRKRFLIQSLKFFNTSKKDSKGKTAIQCWEFLCLMPETAHDAQTHALAYWGAVSALSNAYVWTSPRLASEMCWGVRILLTAMFFTSY